MSSKAAPLAATVLLAAAGPLFLSGCGGANGGTTQAPTTPASPDSTAPPDNNEVTTTTTTTRPQSICCWSRWGSHYDCGNYPEGGGFGGFCNNDGSTTCGGNADCAEIVVPSTTPPPLTTTWKRPTTTTTTLPEGACLKTHWSGCLNGQSFIYNERFACGKGGNIGVRKWGESSCCALGRTYDPHDAFCCNNGLSLHTDGQCREYDASDDPAGCRCPSASTSATNVTEVTEPEPAAGAEDTVIIDTMNWENQPESPCLFANGSMGCLNGFEFDPSSDTICGQYIVKGDTHGCCPRADGIATYNLQTESCCQYGDSAVVRPGAHQCQCRTWPSPNCEDSLFSAVV